LAVVRLPPLVRRLDDLVLDHDSFVAKAETPRMRCRLEFARTELALHPTVQVVYSVGMHPHRRQDLPAFGSLRRIEGHPSSIGQPQSFVEPCDVARVANAQMPTEGFQELRAQLIRRAPEQDLQIVEIRAEFKVAEYTVGIDRLGLARKP